MGNPRVLKWSRPVPLWRLRKFLFVAAAWGLCLSGIVHASNAERIEEILGTPQGIVVKEFRMTAKHFEYNPKLIVVNQGDYFKLRITSLDGTHGFKIPGTNIRHTLNKGQEEDIVLYARDRGKVGFQCSHFCGVGHFFMSGTIVIE